MKIESSVIENWKEKVIDTDTLIQIYGEDVLFADLKGETLLHIAIKLNDKHLFKDLLNRNNLPFYKLDSEGLSPLRLAIRKKREKMCKLILKHPEFDIKKEKKSDTEDFLFEREKIRRNYTNNTTNINKEEFYSMTDEKEELYKPSLLSLVLLNNMSSLYYEIAPLLDDEELSNDFSSCFEYPGFSELSYKSPVLVSIFEIALYSNELNIAMSIFNKNPSVLKNLLMAENYKKKLLFYTSKDVEWNYNSKIVLKNYPLHNLLDMFIHSDFIKKNKNQSLKNGFIYLKDSVEGKFFDFEDDFIPNLHSLVEQFIILNTAQKTETTESIKRKRM